MKKRLLLAMAGALALIPILCKVVFPELLKATPTPALYLILIFPTVVGLYFVYYVASSDRSHQPLPQVLQQAPRPVAPSPVIESPSESINEAVEPDPIADVSEFTSVYRSPQELERVTIEPLEELEFEEADEPYNTVEAAPVGSQSQETFSELVQLCDDSPHLYCVASFNGEIIEANDAAKRLYREAGLERLGTSWYDMVHTEDQYATAMIVSTLLAGDARISAFRNRIRTIDGYRWMDWTIISKHESQRIYLVGQDVTEFQSSFIALSDSELRFRVAFSSMHEGMVLVDNRGRLTLINQSAQVILGMDEEEALGRHIFPSNIPLLREDGSTLTPEDHPLTKALLSGQPQPDLIFGFHNSAGDLRWLEANAVPLFHEGETTAYAAVSTIRDVTETREINEQIQSYMITLEHQKQQLEISNARLEEANQQLQKLATTDAITGLRNHRAFQERLVEEIMRAERYKTPLSLILLDVDQFKSYNDSFGHPAGDEVLRRLADILREHARTHDLVARYGGEEFILLTPHTDLAGAEVVAERCRAAIEKVSWPLRLVTASFGVATLGQGIETGTELIACADHALYAAKAGGRNRVNLYAPALGKQN